MKNLFSLNLFGVLLNYNLYKINFKKTFKINEYLEQVFYVNIKISRN